MTICERTGVWAALSERSYGGIGFDGDGILSGLIKAKADVRSTKKYAQIQGTRRKNINKQHLYWLAQL